MPRKCGKIMLFASLALVSTVSSLFCPGGANVASDRPEYSSDKAELRAVLDAFAEAIEVYLGVPPEALNLADSPEVTWQELLARLADTAVPDGPDGWQFGEGITHFHAEGPVLTDLSHMPVIDPGAADPDSSKEP